MVISFMFKTFASKLLPKTLLARFMLIIILPTIILQLLAIYLFYERHWYNVSEHTSDLIVKEIQSLLSDVDYKAKPKTEQPYLNLQYKFTPNTNLSKKYKDKIEEFKIFKKSLSESVSYPANITLNSKGAIKLFLQINKDLLEITLPKKTFLSSSTHIFVIWILSLTALLLSISLIFSRNQIRSILELTKAADNYGRGGQIDNYKPAGALEIKQAGLAFLKMKHRIEHQTAKRTQMLAMISHDLRTPLTRMKLQVELMANSEEKEELEHDIESMQHMIESYLDFSRGEGGEAFIQIDLRIWLTNYLKTKWSEKNIELILPQEAMSIQLKTHSFARAMTNVIENAFQYATKVKISVFSLVNNAMIHIEDNGTGIEDKEKKQVLKPFYRGDKSRSLKNSSNVGLGLAITKEIITGHYGSISLEDGKELKGLLVKILLPKIRNKDEA